MSLTAPEHDPARLSATRQALVDAWIHAGAGAAKPTIPRRPAEQLIPLSFAQERLWFLNQFAPDVPVNNLGFAVRMRGPILVETLEYVLGEVFRRHEAMRTTFPIVDGRPTQRVSPTAALRLAIRDIAADSEVERLAAIDRETATLIREPFDLVNGPVWRTAILRFNPMDLVLVVTFHHIAADARSVTLLRQELDAIASAYLAGGEPTLPSLPVQYPDFAVWQRSALPGPVLEADLAYWTDRLRGMPPVLDLPADRARPARQTYAGACYRFDLDEDLIAAVRELSRHQGATLFMTLLAAFNALLHRYTGVTDLAVGTPVSGRSWPEVEPLIGLFVNTLVMRTDCSGDPTLRTLIKRVSTVAREAYRHQTLPFERLVDEIHPHRDLSRMPVVQVMFNLRDDEGPSDLQYGPLTTTRLPRLFPGTATYDLAFDLVDGSRGAFVEYSSALFDESTIARMTHHYCALLRSAIEDPDQPISRLRMLSPSERRVVVSAGTHGVESEVAPDLYARFAAQVVRSPQAPAIEAEGAVLTYADLDARVGGVASALQTAGIGPEVAVGVCIERSIDSVSAMLAVLSVGGVYVPVDAGYPQARVAQMLQISRAAVLLTGSSNLGRLRGLGIPMIAIDTLASGPPTVAPGPALPENLAYVIFTSGSTGEPKGVGISRATAARHLQAAAAAYQLEPGDRVLQFASVAFDAAIEQVLTALLSGACLVLRGEDAWDPAQFVDRARDLDLTVANLPTPFWNQLRLESVADVAPRLRLVIAGGDVMSPENVTRWRRGPLRQARLLNAYGPTEATITAAVHAITDDAGAEPPPSSIPIGRALGERTLLVLDRHGEPVPVGVPGELHIGGPLLARGYMGQPDLSAARFIPDPFTDRLGGRLYRTGDLARWRQDGSLEYLGRRDGQVKLRGFRVELTEVTATLGQHPAVAECVTLVRPDGNGDRLMVAYVVAAPGERCDIDELRRFVRERLPHFMVPATFVIVPSLPRTITGKVDRAALPDPDPARGRRAGGSTRTATEEMVAAIWGDVLSLDSPGTHENFFDLGGHSLLATQVVARMRETFKVNVSLRRLFEAPTIAEQAADVDRSMTVGGPAPPAVTPRPEGAVIPLSFSQQRLWFLDQWLPDDPFYNIPVPLKLTGPLDRGALEQSLNDMVRRHEVLRASFPAQDGRAVQEIAPRLTLRIPLVNVSALDGAEQEIEARRLAEEEGRRRFDLAAGPLVRALLVRLAPERHLLVLTLHHIVADGWSMAIIVRELSELYSAARDGRPPSLTELRVQYPDFAVWQQATVSGERRERLLAYWTERLGGPLPALQLPTDRPRPLVQRYADAHRPFTLPPALVDRLKAVGRSHRVTTFMTLLAAFQVLLARYSGQRDLVLGTTVGGRDEQQLEDLIGCFVNTIVLRTDLSGNPSFSDLLRRVRDVTLGAYAHQELPFEQLVETLQPDRDLSRTPLFQVMFAFQNMPPESIESAGLRFDPIALEASPTRCDLTLVMRDNGGSGSFEYDADLFDAATIDRMAANFMALLERVLANPDSRIDDVDVLTDAERDAIERFNNRALASSSDGTAFLATHQLFEARAAAQPEAIALQWDGGSMTYGELEGRAGALAGHLRRCGAGRETLIGLLLPRSPDMVIGLFAALKSGAAYLPLDPQTPVERLRYMLEDSGTPIVLTHAALADRLVTSPCRVIALDEERPGVADREVEIDGPHPADLAYVIYTSGSTGRPKGTLLTHEGLANYVSWAIDAYQLDRGRGAPVHSPLGFDLTITSLLVPLAAGQTVTLLDEGQGIDALVSALRSGPAYSLVKLTPAHLEVLGRQLTPAQAPACARFMVIGGENLSRESITFWREHAPATVLVNEYGPTETVVGCCVYSVPNDLPDEMATVPIGRPIQDTWLYVLDQRMRPVPIGSSGELCIGGRGLARGYLNRPDLTAERFVPDPFSQQPGGRLYRSGDLARYRPDGTLECLGRLDAQVKIRGYRIEPGEVETLLSQHASVQEAAVMAWTNPSGDKQLVAYLVSKPGTSAAPCDLREFLKERLPEYMVPAMFIVLAAIPLTRNGKLDRGALPEPDRDTASAAAGIAPRTPLEEVLAGIWEEVLQVDAVGVTDNFFALGGHSLVAIQAITRVRELFGVDLLLRSFFESPTVEQLAAAIEADPVGREKAAKVAEILDRAEAASDQTLTADDAVSLGAA